MIKNMVLLGLLMAMSASEGHSMQNGATVGPSQALPGAPAIAPPSAVVPGPVPVTPANVSLLEAVQSTLATNPQLKIQHLQVEISRGARQIATGLFDFDIASSLLQQRVNTPLTTEEDVTAGTTSDDQVTELTTYGFQGSKLFRDGVSFTPSFSLERSVDNLVSLRGTNTANVSLQLNIPLLQGRGKAVVAAQETAASQEVTATMMDDVQLATQLMTVTVDDYWNLVAAYKVLAIDIASERRGTEYRDNVQALIDADAVPRSDLNAAAANLAQRAATRALAQQQLVAARQQLALDMGTDAAGMLTSFQPSEDFPGSQTGRPVQDDASSLHYYLTTALANRGDYRASRLRSQESEVLLVSARNRVLPQLNVTIAAGYAGAQEGRQFGAFFAPAYSGTRGPNAVAGITYNFPIQNNVARGLLVQSNATAGQASTHAGDIARNIGASIVSATSAVGNALTQSAQTLHSVQAYQAALGGQQDRYRLGTGSIVEILTIEDLLTNAMLSQVQAELAYAQSITQFRYATGMLIAPDQPTQSITADTFRSLPQAALDPKYR